MGFLAGVAAVRVSKTGTVGAVCETSGIDSMWRYCEGFRAGVKFTDKHVKALIIYRENGDREKLFVDEKWGYETAQGLIKRGADVIFAAGGVTGQGAIRAAVESGVQAIGAERDQAAALGESRSNVVTSVYPDASLQIQYELLVLKNGSGSSLPPARTKFAPLDDKYPESFTRDLRELTEKLWNGEIKTYVTPQ
jgi:basic membrane protein A